MRVTRPPKAAQKKGLKSELSKQIWKGFRSRWMTSGLRGIFRSGLGTGGRFPDGIEERESDVRHAIPIRDNLAQFRYEPTAR